MNTAQRSFFAIAAIVASASLLAGCSLLGGPSRDSHGQVTESTEVNATLLLVGDCFSYLDDASRVTIIPCTGAHTHIVVGQGTLATAQVDEAGGLQNAVSVACEESFTAFKASLAEGLKTKQEFLVSTKEVDGEKLQAYSCVELDPTP